LVAWNFLERTCDYCGKQFMGSARTEHSFCTPDHFFRYEEEESSKRAGIFRETFDKYIEFVKEQYRGNGITHKKVGVVSFLEFCQQHGIQNLAAVDSKTVSRFISWGKKTGRNLLTYISDISAFMDWLVFEGHRRDNPVTRFHYQRRPKRLPRPYSEEEMQYIWSLLLRRGSTVAKLTVAIAEESGLRIGEITNLRLSDIDLQGRRLFVRLPNKTLTERFAPFGEKTYCYLQSWLAERDCSASNDHLLLNAKGRPYGSASLHYEVARAICKTVQHRKVNEDGLEKWSTHRLRHTMATRLVNNGADAATVMAVGGWATADAMCGYSQVDPEVSQRGYREAMERAKAGRESQKKRTTSFTKYLNHNNLAS
jgi:site-specific recombinase XerD